MNNEKRNGIEKKQRVEASNEMNASELAWQMFKKSGNINYYRLYSDLKKKDE